MHRVVERTAAVRARQQRQWTWHCASWGLVVGGALGCAAGLVRFAAPEWMPWPMLATLVILAPIAGAAYALVRPCGMRDAAASIDLFCGLKDRMTTALGNLAGDDAESPIRQLQLADAAKHAEGVDPARVAVVQAPRSLRWGLGLTIAAAVIAIVSNPPQPVEAAVSANDVVTAQASRVAEELEELEEFNREEPDAEVNELLQELAALVKQLEEPSMDPREALAKLSEIEAALQQHQAQLVDPQSDAALEQIGEALSLSEAMEAAGQAMSHGELEKAADELAKLDLPKLDAQTERALVEKLAEVEQNTGDGLRRTLREAAAQVAAGLSQGSRSKFREGMEGLAGECRAQSRRKKLSDLLRKQCQCLAECKGECESECKKEGTSNKKGGTSWGLASSTNEPGDKTPRLKGAAEMHITGQESGEGDVDVETMDGPEQSQDAVREYREMAKKYEQLSESVLDSEPIPLGHRQTIRRYFELIRPQNAELDAMAE